MMVAVAVQSTMTLARDRAEPRPKTELYFRFILSASLLLEIFCCAGIRGACAVVVVI